MSVRRGVHSGRSRCRTRTFHSIIRCLVAAWTQSVSHSRSLASLTKWRRIDNDSKSDRVSGSDRQGPLAGGCGWGQSTCGTVACRSSVPQGCGVGVREGVARVAGWYRGNRTRPRMIFGSENLRLVPRRGRQTSLHFRRSSCASQSPHRRRLTVCTDNFTFLHTFILSCA